VHYSADDKKLLAQKQKAFFAPERKRRPVSNINELIHRLS
jgi:hypothetical protein